MDEEKLLTPHAEQNEEVADDDIPALPELSEQVEDNADFSTYAETNTAKKTEFFRRMRHNLLHRALPNILSALAVAVYAALAADALSGHDFDVTRLLKSAVGEFVGGTNFVEFHAAVEKSSGVSSGVKAAVPDNPSPPSDAIAEPSDEDETEVELSEVKRYTMDLSSSAKNSLGISNETPYEVDLHAMLEESRAVPPYMELVKEYGDGAPVVLILHTHATEAYADSSDNDYRSTDNGENVISVGEVIADVLSENGISVIHCTEQFDYPDFNMAYYNAALAIRKYISEYPSISYILDVHRDSILSGDGYAAPLTEHDGNKIAQMMFVIGTDHGGSGHTGWRDNLALAVRLQKSLSDECPTVMRDINLRSASFNEQYTKGSLLLEIGSCASTLDEVENAARLFAAHFAVEIIGE